MASLIRMVGHLTVAVTAMDKRLTAMEQWQPDERHWMTQELLSNRRDQE